jgi:hypothetical protein
MQALRDAIEQAKGDATTEDAVTSALKRIRPVIEGHGVIEPVSGIGWRLIWTAPHVAESP